MPFFNLLNKTMNTNSVFLSLKKPFQVFSTKFCPRNKREWFERSFALNCTKRNGYMCMPNENITRLLEFCYKRPKIMMEPGKKKKRERYSNV